MRCTDSWLCSGLAAFGLLAGCSIDSESSASAASASLAASPASTGTTRSLASERDVAGVTTVAHSRGSAATAARSTLPPPHAVRNWTDVRVQAAERMVAANPDRTYTGAVPETLLAIPVLEIELNGDGSVRRIIVLRHPRQAKDTTEIAINAVRGAAPFGNVSRLPRPWKFVETFLFDDSRRFKPRTLEH